MKVVLKALGLNALILTIIGLGFLAVGYAYSTLHNFFTIVMQVCLGAIVGEVLLVLFSWLVFRYCSKKHKQQPSKVKTSNYFSRFNDNELAQHALLKISTTSPYLTYSLGIAFNEFIGTLENTANGGGKDALIAKNVARQVLEEQLTAFQN